MIDQLKQLNEQALLRLLQQFSGKNMSERSVQIAQRAFYDMLVGELDQHALFIVNHNQAYATAAVQQAWIRIFATANKYDPAKASIKTWAKLMTARCAIDALRRADKQGKRNQAEGNVDAVAQLPARNMQQDVQQDIVRCLTMLRTGDAPNCRLAIKLALDEDLGYQDMCNLLAQQSMHPKAFNADQVRDCLNQAVLGMRACIGQKSGGSDVAGVHDMDGANDADLDRFTAQSFLFVCRKLDAKDAAWMDDMVRLHPDWQAMVDEDAALAAHIRQGLVDARETADYVPLVPFEHIRRTVNQPVPASLADKFKVWWLQLAKTPVRTSRWALVIMLVLGVTITLQTSQFLSGEKPTTEFRAIVGGVRLAVLEVVFKPGVTVAEVRAQLTGLNMHIISGPDRTGLYEVEVSRGVLQDGLQALKSNDLVASAQVQDLRARDSR